MLVLIQKFVQLAHKGIDIFELAVNRCEPDVSHLVYTLELIHDQLAHMLGTDLALQGILQLLFDFFAEFFQLDRKSVV